MLVRAVKQKLRSSSVSDFFCGTLDEKFFSARFCSVLKNFIADDDVFRVDDFFLHFGRHERPAQSQFNRVDNFQSRHADFPFDRAAGILTALGLSLMIDNVFIFLQAAQGVERPLTFLHGAIMQSTLLYVILLPPLLIMALRENIDLPRKIFDIIIFLASLAACIMINTRGAWIDLAIVLPFILAYRFKSRKKFLAVFLAASPKTFQRLQTVATVGSEQSVTERFLMWHSALNMIADKPLTGVGFGNYESAYREIYILDEAKEHFQGHAHNVYLQLWAETGLPGLILFCALFGYILFWSWRRAENIFGLMLFTATLDLMLYSLTDYTFAAFSAMRVYWLLFGVCVAGIKFNERKNFSV